MICLPDVNLWIGPPAKNRKRLALCANLLLQWNVRGHNLFVLLPRLTELNLNGILKKNLANIRNHGVSFQTASLVFYDPNIVYRNDEKHSDAEQRDIAIGIAGSGWAFYSFVNTIRAMCSRRSFALSPPASD